MICVSSLMYIPEPNTGCWLWLGSIDTDGYARYAQLRAHRLIYEFYTGPIPNGLVIDHLCRVSSCVNPDHLEAVSIKTNIRRGSNTRLTDGQVQEIKFLSGKGMGRQEVAALFGISREHVYNIAIGRRRV